MGSSPGGRRTCPRQETLPASASLSLGQQQETARGYHSPWKAMQGLYAPEPQVLWEPPDGQSSLCPGGREQLASCGGVPLPSSSQRPDMRVCTADLGLRRGLVEPHERELVLGPPASALRLPASGTAGRNAACGEPFLPGLPSALSRREARHWASSVQSLSLLTSLSTKGREAHFLLHRFQSKGAQEAEGPEKNYNRSQRDSAGGKELALWSLPITRNLSLLFCKWG